MNASIEIPINHLSELPDVAKSVLNFAGGIKHILFYGSMGAGKTTIIKALCLALGSEDQFSSPTYSIVNEYHYKEGKIYHFDLYRLCSNEELLDLGIEEYLDSKHYCFFEWPEKVESLLFFKHLRVDIEVRENNRSLRLTTF